MDASFSSNAADVIQRRILVSQDKPNEQGTDLCQQFDLNRCTQWIKDRHFQRVALQFPDELLQHSCLILKYLRDNASVDLFILGDTSYGSCCVDEVAAQHYQADSIIHFGHSCLSQTSRLPVLFIYGKLHVDPADCCTQLAQVYEGDITAEVLLLYDVQYTHAAAEIYQRLKETFPNIIFTSTKYEVNETIEGHDISPAKDTRPKPMWICNRNVESSGGCDIDYESCTVIYIGSEGLTLTNMMMTLNKCWFYSYDPTSQIARKESININKCLMRRYYRIEQAKDARIVGIVAGTLGVVNYLDVINRLKHIIKAAGKKSYMFSVGKLNVVKLANFMEVDVFVLVACPENSLLDSSEYYKPIVTPFEMELACNPDREWQGDYVTDFSHLLPGCAKYVAMGDMKGENVDVSLVSGKLRVMGVGETRDGGTEVMRRDEALSVVLSQHDAATFLSSRTYQGLEMDLGQTEVKKVTEGQMGVAMAYTDEHKT